MSQKKNRLRRRALRLSQGNSRLTRKAAAVEHADAESEFDRLMHELRNDRAEAIKAAQKKAEDEHRKTDAARKTAIREIEDDYIEKRNTIIKQLAPTEDVAA